MYIFLEMRLFKMRRSHLTGPLNMHLWLFGKHVMISLVRRISFGRYSKRALKVGFWIKSECFFLSFITSGHIVIYSYSKCLYNCPTVFNNTESYIRCLLYCSLSYCKLFQFSWATCKLTGVHVGPWMKDRYMLGLVSLSQPMFYQWSGEMSKPRSFGLKLSNHSGIWQESWQHCSRDACQIAQRFDNSALNLLASRSREILRWDVLLLNE